MNREIEMMIELQRCWDNVLKGRNGVEKSKGSIANWNSELEIKRSAISSLKDEIKNDKNRIKQSEIELSGRDEQSKRLEDRRLIIKTEKELKALESELQTVNEERSELEDVLLSMMDDLEKKELAFKKMKAELEDLDKRVDNDSEMLLGRIESFKKVISGNQEKYEQILPELSPNIRARFKKLIELGDGKAIVELEDENCGGCHFRLPGYEILDASKNDKIIKCTNCGRFVYTRDG